MTPRNALTHPQAGDKFTYRYKNPGSDLRTIEVTKVTSDRIDYKLMACGSVIECHCSPSNWLTDWPSQRVETITFGSSPIGRNIHNNPRPGDIVIYEHPGQSTTTLVVVLVENGKVYYQRIRDGQIVNAMEKSSSLDTWSMCLDGMQITTMMLAPQPE